MADDEIKILITAVDDVSKKLDTIKANVASMASDSEKQTSALANAFTKTQGSLLILGETAARVDSIFSAYNNLQIRLENSQERLENAQDRYHDTQKKVNELVKAGKKGSEEYADAMQEQERAARGLTISENNLARTQDAVIGTYIQMGVSVVVLVGAIPALIQSIQALILAWTGLEIAMGPIGWILIAIGAAIANIVIAFKFFKREAMEAKAAQDEYANSLKNVNDAFDLVSDKARSASEAIRGVYDAMKGQIEVKKTEELENLQAIAKKKNDLLNIDKAAEAKRMKERTQFYLNAGASLADAVKFAADEGSAAQINAELRVLEEKQKSFETQRELKRATLEVDNRYAETLTGLYQENTAAFKTSSDEIINYMNTTFLTGFLDNIQKQKDAYLELQRAHDAAYGVTSANVHKEGYMNNLPSFNSNSSTNSTTLAGPRLSLLGNGGNTTNIHINGDNYGINANQVATALQKKLGLSTKSGTIGG